jgi:hypothetical protein
MVLGVYWRFLGIFFGVYEVFGMIHSSIHYYPNPDAFIFAEDCVDKRKTSWCQRRQHKCNAWRWRAYMTKNCRMTCKVRGKY